MDYDIDNDELRFHCPSPRRRRKVTTVTTKVPPGITRAQLVVIAEAMILLMTGLAVKTFQSYSRSLGRIFNYFLAHGLEWPDDSRWRIEIFNLYSYQLMGFSASRATDSSRSIWIQICIVLRALMQGGAIPECPLPNANLPAGSRAELDESLPLGEKYEEVEPPPAGTAEVLPKEYLVDLSYLHDSEDFFDIVRLELEKASKTTFEVCMAYWEVMQYGHSVGRALIKSISREELLVAIDRCSDECFSRDWKGHPADPSAPQGLAYILAAVDYFFFDKRAVSSLCLEAFSEIPFFARICKSARKRKILFDKLRVVLKAPGLSGPDLMARGVGLLSSRDCAAIAAILIHEQPRFTPGSLEAAEAYDKNGKLHVSLTDANDESVFFTIAKDRAKSRKGGVLTKLASKILVELHQMMRRLRARLKDEQPEVARQLFLVVTKSGMGHVGELGAAFNLKKNSLFSMCRAQLESAGMDCHTFTLKRLRTTQGILVWLRTEAVICMAAAMGNSVKTVFNNYIPDWLYHRMLVSIVRRVQQKIIVLATAGERWQVHVSDFTSMKNLENFIIKSLASDKGGNPLSEAFYRRFSEKAGESEKNYYDSVGNEFKVCISPESIAALEVYVVLGSRSPFVLCPQAGEKELKFTQLSRLYQLLSAAISADPNDESEALVVDLIAGGSLALLRSVWNKSRRLVEEYMRLAKI